MLSIIFTIYTLAGVGFSMWMIVHILMNNIMPKKHYKYCLVFPVHTFIVVAVSIISYTVFYYTDMKKRTGGTNAPKR